MNDGTVKLSGHVKDRFLERFICDEPSLDPAARERLAARARSTFTSIRVRKAALRRQRTASVPEPAPAPAVGPAPDVARAAPQPAAEIVAPPAPAPVPAQIFDAYAVKLVPVFQREGRDGLMARLADVGDVGHLRQMARAQQIILPEGLRSGEVSADAVREGIADAVAKRIADRRAAAG